MKYLTVKDLKEFIKTLPDTAVIQIPGTDKYGYETFVPVECSDINLDVGFIDDVYVTLNIGI